MERKNNVYKVGFYISTGVVVVLVLHTIYTRITERTEHE
jgi:uncharacterized membrane protein YjfL (UPF0719 family)